MLVLLQISHNFFLIMGKCLLYRKKLYKTLHYSPLTPTSKNGPLPYNGKKHIFYEKSTFMFLFKEGIIFTMKINASKEIVPFM